MKLGTENKNKTIIALVLAGLALVLVGRWILTPSTSTSTPKLPTAASATGTIQDDADQNQHQSAKRQHEQRDDQKVLSAAWKPTLDPRLNLSLLKSSEDITYEGNGRNIFEATPEPAPEIPQPKAPGRIDSHGPFVPPPPPGPPPPPPINLKFFGYETKGGQRTIFLLQGDTTFLAREGDIIARRYKIVRISPNSVEVQDMLSNNKQTISLTAG
jgi:hypothetical protein